MEYAEYAPDTNLNVGTIIGGRSDFEMDDKGTMIPKEDRFLSLMSTVYTFTEVFEFAARLASKGALYPETHITVSLHGLDDRILSDWNRPYLSREYVCKFPSLTLEDTYSTEELIADGPAIARRAYVDVFHRFGWTAVGPDLYKEDQEKFLTK